MNERISHILHHRATVPVGVGLTSFIVGVGVGYLLGRRQEEYISDLPDVIMNHPMPDPPRVIINEEALAKIHEEEKARVDRGREIVEEIHEEEKKSKPEPLHIVPEPDPEPEPELDRSVFAKDNDDWDYAKEIKARDKATPYIIHQDEFYSDEKNYTQCTLTYFAGDNIMIDENDTPLYNHEQIVGPLQFGHGSHDPNTFHVRNDKRKTEYEIVYNEGQYSVEVLGLEIENNERVNDLKHSGVRRFRQE